MVIQLHQSGRPRYCPDGLPFSFKCLQYLLNLTANLLDFQEKMVTHIFSASDWDSVADESGLELPLDNGASPGQSHWQLLLQRLPGEHLSLAPLQGELTHMLHLSPESL